MFDGVRRLAQALAAHGDRMSVRVFGLRDGDTDRDLPSWDGVPVCPGRVAGPRAFGYCPEFLKALREETPDLLHVHGLWIYPSVACLRSTAKTQRPYIVSPHGMLDPWTLRKSAWKKKLAAWLYENRHLRGAACLHAVSAAEAEAVRGYGLRNPVCVIPYGVDLPGDDGAAPPWANRMPENAQVLLYLGACTRRRACRTCCAAGPW
jgi:poly(glycerol-phosphate) alpha-glucosyltransferase